MMFLNAFILLSLLAVQCLAVVQPWYNCFDPDDNTGVSYSDADIQRAILEAYRRALDQNLAMSSHNNLYPRRYYYNVQNWIDVGIDSPRINTNNLIEFPLVQGGVFGDGSPAGQDRVIIDAATGAFAGVLTHRGAGNSFNPCPGSQASQQQPEEIPPIAVYNPPFGSRNPATWGLPFGPENGGSGPFKREKARAVEIRA
ncbi:hypothetical protein V8E54_003238 [Elaphomyces granulatus]